MVKKFGDPDRQHFRSAETWPAAQSDYNVFLKWRSFNFILERIAESRYLLNRIQDGVAKDGILAFDFDPGNPGGQFPAIYVAFCFSEWINPLKRIGGCLFKPAFLAFGCKAVVLWLGGIFF